MQSFCYLIEHDFLNFDFPAVSVPPSPSPSSPELLYHVMKLVKEHNMKIMQYSLLSHLFRSITIN